MNKEEFILCLKEKMSGFPTDTVGHTIEYYSEIIDDSIEDGASEAEAVEALGSVDDIVSEALSEMPLQKLIKSKVRPRRVLRVWEIILIVLGFPVWLPLIAAIVCVFISVYAVIWSAIVSLWSADLAIAVSGLSGMVYGVASLFAGRFSQGAFYFGAGLVCAGLSVLLFFAFKQITVWMIKLSKRILIGIKSLFVGKGGTK